MNDQNEDKVMLCVPLADVIDTLTALYTAIDPADPGSLDLVSTMLELELKRYRPEI